MKVAVIGSFPAETRKRIRKCFPADWQVEIGPEEMLPGDVEAVIPEHVRVDGAFLDRAPGLRMVQTGAGYDNVDLAECRRRGILVCTAAGVNAAAVAEHTMAMLLCWYKNLLPLDRSLRDGRALLDYTGGELAGKTVGVVGLGAIGSRVARYCAAFDMRVLGYSRHPGALPGVETADLDTLFRECDVVTLHLPLNGETRHLVGQAAFGKMKPGALLINTSRGGVVDETALVRALGSGTIGGACLDVFEEEPLPEDSPLRTLPNVILTPHTAGFPDGVKFHEKRYRFFARNIARAFAGETPENLRGGT
ncbi:NAD(P)-dependent oxidoreductase [Dysosmobacter sp.]|uniref:NAD(P)-dependent oxidoreductase n=1 Tax=Dysosmobacter sp. TaxID=2591382 RepID=UPI002A8D5A6D|nr:NAD(P)-dependent oxidoreductase [Dysosmobacter sp.]MDY3281967.1 NAD(P)-dependent oxidoreductase [Dysosmobacter sp.]